jgi:hypothetical protein
MTSRFRSAESSLRHLRGARRALLFDSLILVLPVWQNSERFQHKHIQQMLDSAFFRRFQK